MSDHQSTDQAFDTLFISSDFFGYAREIKNELERQGRSVLWSDDRPAQDTASKIAIRLTPKLLKEKSDQFFATLAARASKHPIRDVLVIKGEALSTDAIKHLRAILPNARFVLYFWDSYRNMPSESRHKVSLFDRALSFDPVDVANDPRLAYRPLFFLEDYRNLPKTDEDIDLLFFGTAHTDRYAVVKRIERILPSTMRFEKILYVPSELIYKVRRVVDPAFWFARRAEFVFQPQPKHLLLQLIARSRMVVDIERTIQSGYTMRTCEMLGAEKKLITTNPEVVKSDFYRPSNIALIDRRNPIIPERFLLSPYEKIPSKVVNRYSLKGWIEDLLNNL